MAAIRHRDTKPEMIVRRLLHAAGFRYRLHRKDLPGTPDLTLKKWNAVIEVQGCFWHAHNCHLFRRPADNADFWSEKLGKNVGRDIRNAKAIAELGMRRLIVWECALKGPTKLEPQTLKTRITDWIIGSEPMGEIQGLGQ
jgi:DNA mismatch endonuclease (patch repair protein)